MDAVAVAGVAARLLQYAAAAGSGTALFLIYGWRPASQGVWRRALAALFALGTLASVAWLMTEAAAFGRPSDAFAPAQVWSVAADTSFGQAALARAVLFALTAVTAAAGRWRLTSLLAALASISFAFGGHAAADDGLTGVVHMTADAAHALTAAIWLGALPPLLVLLRTGRTADARAGLDRFSAIGPAVVAVLALTGLINGWLIIGPDHLGVLLTDGYGRTLALKLVLFAAMLALAAANRWRLAPRLEAGADATVARELKASLRAEILLGLGVLILVSLLGTLAPGTAG